MKFQGSQREEIMKTSPPQVVLFFAAMLTTIFLNSNLAMAGPKDFLRKFTAKKVEADPAKEYTLSETNGPWMILVHTFSGPKAKESANQLVYQLRKDYNLKAYGYSKTFEHDTRKEQFVKTNPYAKTRPQYNKKGKVQEFAVLIGDFQSIDDLDLQNTLQAVRECFPECMKQFPGQKIPKGATTPFVRSFAVTNPILGSDFFGKNGYVDDFVAKLNEQRPYSLLNCPGKYSVQIATFSGKVEIKPENVQAILDGRKSFTGPVSELELGEKAAVKLCKILRDNGFEAYEFHDRYQSIVTVGSFNSLGRQLPNGLFDSDPQIQAIMQHFQGKPATQGVGENTITHEPKKYGNIECDIQPRVIEVPRRRR